MGTRPVVDEGAGALVVGSTAEFTEGALTDSLTQSGGRGGGDTACQNELAKRHRKPWVSAAQGGAHVGLPCLGSWCEAWVDRACQQVGIWVLSPHQSLPLTSFGDTKYCLLSGPDLAHV